MIIFLHAALFVVLSSFSPASVISLLQASFLFFSSLVSPHLTFFSLRAPLSFSSHIPLESFFCSFLGRLHHSCCRSNVFISDIVQLLVTPHINLSVLISFTSIRTSCPLVVAYVSAPYNRWSFRDEFFLFSHKMHWKFPLNHIFKFCRCTARASCYNIDHG